MVDLSCEVVQFLHITALVGQAFDGDASFPPLMQKLADFTINIQKGGLLIPAFATDGASRDATMQFSNQNRKRVIFFDSASGI